MSGLREKKERKRERMSPAVAAKLVENLLVDIILRVKDDRGLEKLTLPPSCGMRSRRF